MRAKQMELINLPPPKYRKTINILHLTNELKNIIYQIDKITKKQVEVLYILSIYFFQFSIDFIYKM